MNKQTRKNNLGKFLSQRKSKGFTIIEVLITMVLLGIVLAYGVPKFEANQARAKIRSLSEDIESTFILARAGAISRGERVTVCPVKDTVEDFTSSLGKDICLSGSWKDLFSADSDGVVKSGKNAGLIVFADGNDDGKIDNISNIIKLVKLNLSSGKIKILSSNQESYTFNRKGQMKRFSGTITLDVEKPKSLRGLFTRKITIANSGRIKNVKKK